MSRITAGELALRPKATLVDRCRDYAELSKLRIAALELVTVAVAAQLAAPHHVDGWRLLHVLAATALVAASASAMNQWLERDSDRRMRRTAQRPLPAGRLASAEALVFATLTLALGAAYLTAVAGVATTSWALATWLIYVVIYTPLKYRTPLNTAVGAISGALPILIGWTAMGAPVDLRAAALVLVVFLWQFPHFMAIAWLYRDDYRRGGQRMLTLEDSTGLRAGAQALVAALLLIPVSLVPAISPASGSPGTYAFWTLVLGGGQLICAACFFFCRSEANARLLLRGSLIYLTGWMGLLLMVTL